MLDLQQHLLALENLTNDVRNAITAQEEAAKVQVAAQADPITTPDTLEDRMAAQEAAEREATTPVETTESTPEVTTESVPSDPFEDAKRAAVAEAEANLANLKASLGL